MRLLDLFCGAGGAAMGYSRAGFTEIVGVDIRPMPRYPFEFVRGDALDYLRKHGHEFDAVHASPPCQGYSMTQRLAKKAHPMLVEDTRAALVETGKPYVIENVPGAPLLNPTLLCGLMFGLSTYRHRIFETSFEMPFTLHAPHHAKQDKLHGPHAQRKQDFVVVVGNAQYKGYLARARAAMGIGWMNEKEIAQSIPPAYTEYIGRHLLEACRSNDAGELIIPAWAVARWARQMSTPYYDLPGNEPNSDRDEADKIMKVYYTHQAKRKEPAP